MRDLGYGEMSCTTHRLRMAVTGKAMQLGKMMQRTRK